MAHSEPVAPSESAVRDRRLAEVADLEGTPIATLLVHGALHLAGYDHESDDGRMLRRQAKLLEEVTPVAASAA